MLMISILHTTRGSGNMCMRTNIIRAKPAPPTDALAFSTAAGHRCDSITSARGMQNTRENSEIRTNRLIPPTSCAEQLSITAVVKVCVVNKCQVGSVQTGVVLYLHLVSAHELFAQDVSHHHTDIARHRVVETWPREGDLQVAAHAITRL